MILIWWLRWYLHWDVASCRGVGGSGILMRGHNTSHPPPLWIITEIITTDFTHIAYIAAWERGAGRVANYTSFQSIIPRQKYNLNFPLIIYVEILNATLYICCFMFFLLPVTLNISIAKWTAVLINRYIYNYKHKPQQLYIHYHSEAKKGLQLSWRRLMLY